MIERTLGGLGIRVVAAAFLAAAAGCGGSDPCPGCDACPEAACDACPTLDTPSDVAGEASPDVPADVAGDPAPEAADVPSDPAAEVDVGPSPPTYWSAEATHTVDDLVFVTYQGKKVFGLGIHPSYRGAWDGVTGPNGCACDDVTGTCTGTTNDGVESTHLAAGAGANFVYTWGYEDDPEYLHVDPPFLGIWHGQYGTIDAAAGPGHEAIPIIACEYGETDLDGFDRDKAGQMKADFEDFQARRGRWSKEAMPNLPPYEEMPWFCWHPTFRMSGGGDGYSELFTDEQVELYARTTNMMIGDTYTYVCNRYEGIEAVIMGQKGPKGECYDDWLARDDPDHRSYFEASWKLAHSLRTHANPDAVVWMWMQGHAFDDDIGGGVCRDGQSGLWANGPFPTLRYLRKEILSTIVAGGTGFIYFGYGYNRQATAEKLRGLVRALASTEVYGPALLSPRLDVGQDLQFAGEGGRAHLMAKWDAESRTAFLLGANPGAWMTPFEVTFPWTVAKVEMLDWFTPGWIEDPAVHGVEVADRTVRWTAPQDDGFILRVTPLFAGEPAGEVAEEP